MNKKVTTVVLMVVLMMLLSSCGMSWQNWKKDFKSDLGGGLERTITVTNMLTGEEVWAHEGISYIKDDSGAGDVTIMYYNGRDVKKADFLGTFYGVSSIEK